MKFVIKQSNITIYTGTELSYPLKISKVVGNMDKENANFSVSNKLPGEQHQLEKNTGKIKVRLRRFYPKEGKV